MHVVRWKREALDQLAELWMQSAYRDELNETVKELDLALSANPYAEGESRSGNRRITFTRQLGVAYEIDDHKKLVQILRVWPRRSAR